MKSNRNSILLLFFFILYSLLLTTLNADTKPSWRSFTETGKYITAIAWDKDNHLWVAGEEFGVSLILPDWQAGRENNQNI